jgi:hypothetical protein
MPLNSNSKRKSHGLMTGSDLQGKNGTKKRKEKMIVYMMFFYHSLIKINYLLNSIKIVGLLKVI